MDRAWVLPERQNELIQKVTGLNEKTIVVLSVGGGVETESWVHKTAGLIHSYFLGETVGEALAGVLSGRLNPSGKLPFTMAKKWDDFASTANYVDKPGLVRMKHVAVGQGNPKVRKVWQMRYDEGLSIGYRHFDTADIEPQFPFGFGLSYSSFELENAKVTENAGLPLVEVTVSNTGTIEGSEVVQCYVHDQEASVFRPEKELKAFKKVHLKPGASAKVEFALTVSDFQFYDEESGEWKLEPGIFDIILGSSSRDMCCVLPFEV